MPLSKDLIGPFVSGALAEDAAYRDITTLTFIPQKVRVEARIVAKEEGVVCGAEIAQEVFRVFDRSTAVAVLKKDGALIKKGQVVLTMKGRARSILSCERVALNFLSYLSGISTNTHRAVHRVRAKGIQVLDTRKTTPFLRVLEKYAVTAGGGRNHRFDLSDQYLVKDNHIVVLDRTTGFSVLSRKKRGVLLEVEVEDLDGLKEVLAYRPDIVMLDNFPPARIKAALRLLAKALPSKKDRPKIELSGGITLDNISRVAIRGVDFISLGALTHSSPSLDFSLEITKVYG